MKTAELVDWLDKKIDKQTSQAEHNPHYAPDKILWKIRAKLLAGEKAVEALALLHAELLYLNDENYFPKDKKLTERVNAVLKEGAQALAQWKETE